MIFNIASRRECILDNQIAFKYGAMEEFGLRDNHFEEEGEIISKATIESSIDEGIAYRIVNDGEIVGGLVLKLDGTKGDLELLFVKTDVHSKGIGYAAWCEVERMYPQIKIFTLLNFLMRNTLFRMKKIAKQERELMERFDFRKLSAKDYDVFVFER